MIYRIMCAYESSPTGDKAFEFALALAKQFDGELFVLSVFQPAEEARNSAPAELLGTAKEEFTPAFERLRAQAANLARPAQFDVSVGYRALQVLSEAARLNVHHIVVGAETKQTAVGSTASRIALLAQCTVTVMR